MNIGTPHQAVARVDVLRVQGAHGDVSGDGVAVEAPLEVRLDGEPFSVIMRTPGDDRHLVLGFLLSEGVVHDRADVRHIDADDAAGTADVRLADRLATSVVDALATRRRVVMNASCGMCGRRSLESLGLGGDPFTLDWRVTAEAVRRLPAALAAVQPAFAETGGLHAAGLFDGEGRLIASAEDVGRHNAVDKLAGRMFAEGRLPLDRTLLFVSGRSSFEILQKARIAGVRIVAAVSAPSSLAVELARESGITLIGFVRGARFNVYTHDARVDVERA